MAEMPFDINTLSEEQRRILLGQLQAGQAPQGISGPPAPVLPTITDQKDRSFLGNIMQRKLLNPLQVKLGLRDSPQDVLRQQQSILNQYELQGMQQDRQRNNQAVEYIRGLTEEQGQQLGLNAAQLALAKANPMQAYDDIVSRSFERETFSTTPQFGVDATGGRIAYQLSDRGGAKVLDYTPSQEYRTIDDGESIQVYDKYSDRLIQTIPKQMTPEQQERLIIEKRKETKDDKEKLRANAKGLRTEFTNITKNDRDIALAYNKIIASASDPSAAGDIALIINYMKMLDPGSVVREGEFATAANAGGVEDSVRARYNSVVNGERLSVEQRQDFVNASGRVLQPYRDQFEATKSRYSTLATEQGLQPSQVVTNDPYSGLRVVKRDRQWYESRGLTPPAGMK